MKLPHLDLIAMFVSKTGMSHRDSTAYVLVPATSCLENALGMKKIGAGCIRFDLTWGRNPEAGWEYDP